MTPSKPPVLIVGSGRSGTTFLAKLLDSHPAVLYRHEPDWARVNTAIPFLPRPEQHPMYLEQARTYLEELVAVRAPKVCGKEPLFPKQYRSPARERLFRLNVRVARLLDRAGVARKRNLIRDLASRQSVESATPVIKSVNSVARAPLFAAAAPDMPIIHIIRHPAAVIASRLRGIAKGVMDSEVYIDALFEAGYGDRWSFPLEEVKGWTLEERMTFEWMAMNEAVFLQLKAHPNYLVVTHEDLSLEPERETRRMFAHAGLAWNVQSAQFVESLENGKDEDAYFGIQRSPKKQLLRWKEDISDAQIEAIVSLASHSSVGRFYTGAEDTGVTMKDIP